MRSSPVWLQVGSWAMYHPYTYRMPLVLEYSTYTLLYATLYCPSTQFARYATRDSRPTVVQSWLLPPDNLPPDNQITVQVYTCTTFQTYYIMFWGRGKKRYPGYESGSLLYYVTHRTPLPLQTRYQSEDAKSLGRYIDIYKLPVDSSSLCKYYYTAKYKRQANLAIAELAVGNIWNIYLLSWWRDWPYLTPLLYIVENSPYIGIRD